ncbi:MAG: hypothetical protein ACD_66C00167G0001 [uncultured bacterium]|uniref:DUF5667 domain-containing protein n=1 Tax=Candidatus Uhrbacteria bacterium GW2011_GWC1_41_20 TaxID=1618983 RepID=A0A0G0XS48_9BACT|nr:MAG: hypothetical protein ACD_66C00167G0001 [uncultured bacterium]KKR23082.1 MAG: hypothetical protein UT52_C0003G0061 [Candidatus Uhrbacteria bacterium GW2011_GWE1_39_46]KKR64321.1 MAG: hypothetical protein UU04_C0003G0061 [Candidatus Uhrbacteria bacterium GW2011_GWC2_40_450]KKR90491.1 MAG: hypothetical protein UU40_C0003G0061 [Candidatus Uhrbacteria bacterium GW2011_GWD2_41_121]KKR96338.1 MAG: hypothetical protein UU46_C0004G0024 [Candidatus Uhrbacteria bacterium GW2011_GWD1_41_16]KKR9975
MSREVIAQLKSLKNHPDAGWVDGVGQNQAKTQLLTAIGHHDDRVIGDAQVAYIKWNAFSFATRPIGVGLVIFALLFGGWFTTVKAAVGSIPGDTLYNVKLITEQAQLIISPQDQRAVLHTQFAQRRMVEIQSLQQIDDGRSERYLAETVHALETEVVKAGDALTQLKNNQDANTLTVASVLDEKISTLQAELNAIGDQSAKDATETTTAVSNSAVDAIMDVHEQTETQESGVALNRSFKNEYTDLRERQTFDTGRVQTISAIINENAIEGILSGDDILRLQFEIDQATDDVAEAMNSFAAGAYRGAFDMLRDADTTLLGIEARLASIEEQVMTVLNLQEDVEEKVEEVVEEVEIVEENQENESSDPQITQ